jgi:hypothetical protein
LNIWTSNEELKKDLESLMRQGYTLNEAIDMEIERSDYLAKTEKTATGKLKHIIRAHKLRRIKRFGI